MPPSWPTIFFKELLMIKSLDECGECEGKGRTTLWRIQFRGWIINFWPFITNLPCMYCKSTDYYVHRSAYPQWL